MGEALYDQIGADYRLARRADPRIAARIDAALADAQSVINVGAGSGSYEPSDREVLAIEPSIVMANQRPSGAAPVTIAEAEDLPFSDDAFDAAMAIFTVHHWRDPEAGIKEMRRVARKRAVILTLDPASAFRMWLFEYAPEIATRFRAKFPALDDLCSWLGGAVVEVVPIPVDCRDQFLEAFWARPELILDPVARGATSGFALLSEGRNEEIAAEVATDLANGTWERRWGHLRSQAEYDGGLRLLIADLTEAA